MPRKYKPVAGGRKYRQVSAAVLAAALRDIKNGMTIYRASKKHKIPYATLHNKQHAQHVKRVGRPRVFTDEEECLFVSTLNELADWNYPISQMDLRTIMKDYLDKRDKVAPVFKNNMPGYDFISGFIKRHNLSQRLASNIKRSRAQLSKEAVETFFNNLEDKAEGIPPERIFNFDETNLTDDPGAKKVLVSRGKKRVERLMQHSKASISLMFCISAAGDLLPPYVVYKAQNIYENWCQGGPPGTIYDATRSGWFDSRTFECWFKQIFLPHVKNITVPGKTLVIGDNLASHFSPEVINLCQEEDIIFTTIPPNATHLMQPLDVSYFKPVKSFWRKILEQWRIESRNQKTLPKEHFPLLLSRLYHKLSTCSSNAISGFKKTGIFPFNPAEVLNMLPGAHQENISTNVQALNESVLDYLRTQYQTRSTTSGNRGRGRGRRIPPERVARSEVNTPIPGTSKNNYDENSCGICLCDYNTYRGRDWIQCVVCRKWICGYCNEGSKDTQYQCEACLDD